MYFWLTDLAFDYEDYLIILDLLVELDGETTKKQVELRIERDYREYRSNDLWDVLKR